MSDITTTEPAHGGADLIIQARAAFEDTESRRKERIDAEREEQISVITRALAKFGLKPCGEPSVNPVSGRMCVPLVQGTWDVERETQIHGVGAEWDQAPVKEWDQAPGKLYGQEKLLLVADLDADGNGWSARYLYPAGQLTGLADLGRAIEYGGRKTAGPTPPATASDQVQRHLNRVSGDHIDRQAEVFLSGCEAVCVALLDVADAIRESRA
jgi:hypothetical protein